MELGRSSEIFKPLLFSLQSFTFTVMHTCMALHIYVNFASNDDKILMNGIHRRGELRVMSPSLNAGLLKHFVEGKKKRNWRLT